MADPLTDANAIAASLGNGEVFVVIFDRHFAAISRYLRRRVGRAIADELAGEVFTTAFASRARYDLTRPDARPWLYGIATNLLRANGRAEERHHELLALADSGSHPVPDVATLAFPDELEESVGAALGALARIDREVLLLFAWGELTYEEIATALELPVGTVRSRLNRARGQMQVALEPRSTVAPEGGI